MSISEITNSYDSNAHQFSSSPIIYYIQMGLRLDHLLFLNLLFQWNGKKGNIVCPKQNKRKETCDFFPNKGFFLLVQHSYLKIMNWVCMDILVAAIEIAFLAIFMLPRPFCKSFYLVQWQLPNIRKIPSPNSSMFPRILG